MSVTTVSSSMITDATILNADIGAAAAIATTKLGAGATVQVVNVTSSAYASGTTVMPFDDTIPQKTEGDEYMTLAVTPTSASNKLIIEIQTLLTTSATAVWLSGALFQDTTAGALALGVQSYQHRTVIGGGLSLRHFMTAGTTSATTFKFRAGSSGAATTGFNGQAGGRMFGGIAGSSITITEIQV